MNPKLNASGETMLWPNIDSAIANATTTAVTNASGGAEMRKVRACRRVGRFVGTRETPFRGKGPLRRSKV